MSSGGQWQQNGDQMQMQQRQQEYLYAMSSSSPQQQQQQSHPQHEKQLQQQHYPLLLEQQHNYQPTHQPQMFPHHQYPAHSLASTSSPSSSPLSSRPHVSIHPQDFPLPFPSFTPSDNAAIDDQSSFYPDDTLLAGMGIHLGQPTDDASAFAATFDQAPQFSQQQSVFQWPQSGSSQSINSNDAFDVYESAGSMSEAGFAGSNQPYGEQHNIPIDTRQNIPTSYQQQASSPSTHRSRKPARLNLNDLQSDYHSSSSWVGADAEVTTPNASSSGLEQESQQQQLAMNHSPSWQQQLSSSSHQQHTYHYSGLPHAYRSDSFGSAAPIQDPAVNSLQQDRFAGQNFNMGQSLPYATPPEQGRPMSSASGFSLASSSNNSSAPFSTNRSNSQSDAFSDPSEGSYFGQPSHGSSSNPSWMVPSPSESDASSLYRGASQRKISTPQRLQQRRDLNASSSGNVLSSPTKMGHFNLSAATSMSDIDNTDYRLSAAMAMNARISSSTSDLSSSSRNQRGNTTPTIPEEDSVDVKHSLAQSIMSPSSSLQSYQQSPLIANAFGDHSSDVVVRKHRKISLQPSVFQQYSPYNAVGDSLDDLPDCTSFVDDLMSAYLTTPSRLGLGEKSVLIMTSKVAQKSYGQEKRFLCPPPMVVLVGSSWWSSQRGNGQESTLTPPRLTISMSDENSMQDANLEWASVSGRLIDVDNPSSEMAISGRTIGKQLFINDADDKKRHCEALVHISVPGLSSLDRRTLGTFPSKPIKVISKPSKKRQSNRTSDLSVNHGSTVSLFHRLRSQTVSTRYLCVSGAPTWFKGSDGLPFLNTDENTHIPNQGEPSSCFVAKMSSWDTFIIYLVDPHVEASKSTSNKAAFYPHYPPPPINVLPRMASGQGQPICYNQAVVLQCLNTAVVSPVMIIRRVDRQTTVVGGGQSGSLSSPTGRLDPTVETLGDPVSQLHKIAFEILEDPSAPVPIAENRDFNTAPGQSGHFLGCLNEDVGLRKPLSPRQWVVPNFSGPPTPTTPVTPLHLSLSASALSKGGILSDAMDTPPRMMSDAINAANMAAAQTRYSLSQQRSRSGSGTMSPSSSMPGPSSARSQYSSNGHSPIPPGGSSNGLSSGEEEGNGQVKRPRRVSSSVVVQKDRSSAATKNRRRGQSLSIVGMQNQFQSQQPSPLSTSQQHQQQQAAMQLTFPVTSMPDSKLHLRRTSSFALSLSNSETSSSWGVSPGAMWTVDVHDSDVWTIVGTDIAHHTFYIPPKLVGGIKPPVDAVDQGIAHLVNLPAPATPITPMPFVQHCTGPNSASTSSKTIKAKTTYVTLTGENLTSDFFVYFGDWRCTRVTPENNSTLYCEPPPTYEEFGLPRGRVPLTLVRKDGVVFPTPHFYQC